jgi:hypothetical protein
MARAAPPPPSAPTLPYVTETADWRLLTTRSSELHLITRGSERWFRLRR